MLTLYLRLLEVSEQKCYHLSTSIRHTLHQNGFGCWKIFINSVVQLGILSCTPSLKLPQEYRFSSTKTKLRALIHRVYHNWKIILEPWRLTSIFIIYISSVSNKITSNLGYNSCTTNVYNNCRAPKPALHPSSPPLPPGTVIRQLPLGSEETRASSHARHEPLSF